MKYGISMSNCLKAEIRVAAPQRCSVKGRPKILVFFLERVCWWGVIFINGQASGQCSFSFCLLLQVAFFLASSVIFWAAVFESTFARLLLEQHFGFRDLVIRP